MVSLADLRARNVVPVWQEAVAVVQELIQTVKATTGSAELLPDLEHIALIPNGDVVALPGSPEPVNAVRHAAVMLQLLMEGAATPPELEQFVTRNVANPPQYDTVAEFSRNLAFFERPGRRSDVERLVGRAVAAEQLTRADEELKRLKDRANEVSERPMFGAQAEQEDKPRRKMPTALLAGVLVIAALALPVWWWQRGRTPSAPPAGESSVTAPRAAEPAPKAAASPDINAPGAATPAPIGGAPSPSNAAAGPRPAASSGAVVAAAAPNFQNVISGSGASGSAGVPGSTSGTPAADAAPTSFLGRTANAVRSAVGSILGSDPPKAAATAAEPVSEPRKSVERRGSQRAAAKPPAVTAVNAPAAAAVAPRVAPKAEEPAASLSAASIERAIEDSTAIYTPVDAAVIPPVMVRPVLPREPPPNVRPEDVGTMEVLVDEQGDVLAVKLLSPRNRYHDRMLVSAAKMWKFRPAYKDGRPVRYRTRVRLTI